MRWSNVDPDARIASINQTLQIDKTWGTPKTHRSERKVTLPSFVVDALRVHRKSQNERRLLCGVRWHNLDLVIDPGDGERCDPRSVSRRFAASARAAGVSLTFHGLRHGFATLMLECGVDLKVIQELLGHSSYGITANLYTHVAEKLDRQATDRLDALLFPR